MHRQIGNAVPLPLARALGRELRAVLFKEWKEGRLLDDIPTSGGDTDGGAHREHRAGAESPVEIEDEDEDDDMEIEIVENVNKNRDRDRDEEMRDVGRDSDEDSMDGLYA